MPSPVSQAYPELFHYTTLSGLRGIISNDCLWATDASFLNDSSEITHFFDTRLPKVVRPEVESYVFELARNPDNLARIISGGGIEKLVHAETTEWVDRLKNATLTMNQPFVSSLSVPVDSWTRHSGLLSQWRGYGTDGGFVIVFDSKKLEELLEREATKYHYLHVQIGDVFYHRSDGASQPSSSDVEEYEAVVRLGVSRLIRGGDAEQTDGFYQSVTTLSCLYKHWGFWEEREVRIVAVPATDEVAAAAETAPPRRPIRVFKRGEVSVPYVELFGRTSDSEPRTSLPIIRVIVGPHRDKASRAAEVRAMLRSNGYRSEVVESEIPYIGK